MTAHGTRRLPYRWIALVVVAGTAALLAVPDLRSAINRSKQKRTLSAMRTLATALGAFAADHGGVPSGDRGIKEAWRHLEPRYIVAPPTRDAWGNQLVYNAPAGPGSRLAPRFTLLSLGSDGKYQGWVRDLVKHFDCDLIYAGP